MNLNSESTWLTLLYLRLMLDRGSGWSWRPVFGLYTLYNFSLFLLVPKNTANMTVFFTFLSWKNKYQETRKYHITSLPKVLVRKSLKEETYHIMSRYIGHLMIGQHKTLTILKWTFKSINILVTMTSWQGFSRINQV